MPVATAKQGHEWLSPLALLIATSVFAGRWRCPRRRGRRALPCKPRKPGPRFGGPRLSRPNEWRSLAQPACASSRGCRSLRSASARTRVSSRASATRESALVAGPTRAAATRACKAPRIGWPASTSEARSAAETRADVVRSWRGGRRRAPACAPLAICGEAIAKGNRRRRSNRRLRRNRLASRTVIGPVRCSCPRWQVSSRAPRRLEHASDAVPRGSQLTADVASRTAAARGSNAP
jgi:hypothetical protein